MRASSPITVLLVACGGAEEAVELGPLVAVDEGTTLTRPLAEPSRTSWDDAPWATVVGDQLVLAPGCATVQGVSGPPMLVVLPDADRHQPLVVQVNPSIDGACRPSVQACIVAAGDECAAYQDETTGLSRDAVLRTGFCYAAGCELTDEVVKLRVHNPEGPDGDNELALNPLFARITTDAPIHFPDDPGDPNPRNFRGEVEGELYDANITGDFRITYEIATSMTESAVITTGSYRLLWNEALGFGIEAEHCSSLGGCSIQHDPTRVAADTQCAAIGGGEVMLALRVWVGADVGQRGDANRLYIRGKILPGGQAVVMHSSTETADDGDILLPLVDQGAQALTIDVGDLTDVEVLVGLWTCRNVNPMDSRLCDDVPALMDGTADKKLRVRIQPACP